MAQPQDEKHSMPTEEDLKNLASPQAMVAYAARNALRVLPFVRDKSVRDIEMAIMISVLYSIGIKWDYKYHDKAYSIINDAISDSNNAAAVIAVATYSAIYNSLQVHQTMGDNVSNQTLADRAAKVVHTIDSAIDTTSEFGLVKEIKREAKLEYKDPFYISRHSPFSAQVYNVTLWFRKPEKLKGIIKEWHNYLNENGLDKLIDRYELFFKSKEIESTFWKNLEHEIKEWIEEKSPGSQKFEDESSPEKQQLGISTSLGGDLSDTDLLGRKPIVDALAGMIASEKQDTPFTIGVLGEWGSGKSNLMYLLEKKLSERDDAKRFYFANFNAWEYEHTDNMTAGVAQEVLNAFTKDLKGSELLKLRYEFGKKEHGNVFPVIIIVLLIIGALSFSLYFSYSIDWTLYIGLPATIFGLWGLIKELNDIFTHPIISKFRNYIKLPSYGRHLGTVPILKRHLKILCELIIPPKENEPSRLIVFVDDLDRCEPESISRTLDAIRLVMDIKNVVIIIGIDHRIAFRAVEKQYSELADDNRTSSDIARDYLGKIIQLPIQLRPATLSELDTFISEKLFIGVSEEKKPEIEIEITHKTAKDKDELDELTYESNKAENIEKSTITSELKGTNQNEKILQSSDALQPKVMDEDMVETVEEQANFGELVKLFGMNNPRQLIRLRNCYRMLKRLRHEASSKDFKSMMTMLFWLEYLHAKQHKERLIIQQAIMDTNFSQLELVLNEKIIEVLKNEFALSKGNVDTYTQYKSLVNNLVLPHSESSILSFQEKETLENRSTVESLSSID